MVLKTATYSGMNLKGEIRESISLDEDDLSDVEDEVFIRDGKNGFKLAEELNVKRPLMAPRRKPGKHSSGFRLKPKPSCRVWCKPCCYVLASLSILIGLIVLVVVLVSIYPLPLDRLRIWITSKTNQSNKPKGQLPCTSLKITDVWTLNLPYIRTESPVRTTDINKDGIDDLVFGFRTGENVNIFPPDVFCGMVFGVSPPCDGGVIALDGRTGNILWRKWMNDSVFSVHCTEDINLDGVDDCLISGIDGVLGVVDAKTGGDIWKVNKGKMNVFVANFIEDQNGDNVSDVVASYSSLEEKTGGYILLFNGKTGQELKKSSTPNHLKTFYMPQLISSTLLLVGTGTPTSPGNLSVIPLKNLEDLFQENKSTTLYQDKFKGMLTQSVLVDITGDRIPDIVTSTYNSTVVAINGKSFKKIWGYTLANSITDMSPTPGFFNSDNVTDFMVTYQKYDNIFNYNYTETVILDGVTGQPIYQPVNGGVITQMSGLVLSMEGKGNDIYLFWTSECNNTDNNVDKTTNNNDQLKMSSDECKRQFNSTTVLRLNALNNYHQPPGITVYSSALHKDFEFEGIRSPTKLLREYLKSHPGFDSGYAEQTKQYNGNPGPIEIRKYGSSSFRHKDRPGGIVKDYNTMEVDNPNNDRNQPMDYNMWPMQDNDYPYMGDDNIPYSQKQPLIDEVNSKLRLQQGENVRSKKKTPKEPQTKKKNLSEKIFGYHNVRLSKDRLLHDEDTLPTEILKDNYFKNEENRLRMTLEQRDVNSHLVGKMDETSIKQAIEEQKKEAMQNRSTTLWDLESENEMGELDNRGYRRKKRMTNNQPLVWESLSKVTSVGAVLKPFETSNVSSNLVDVVFIKFWEQSAKLPLETLMSRDIQECVEGKSSLSSDNSPEQLTRFQTECQTEQEGLRRDFTFFNKLTRFTQSQTTVYRIRIRCDCDSTYDKQIKERCANFLPDDLQGWPQYLGRKGDGVFIVS